MRELTPTHLLQLGPEAHLTLPTWENRAGPLPGFSREAGAAALVHLPMPNDHTPTAAWTCCSGVASESRLEGAELL